MKNIRLVYAMLEECEEIIQEVKTSLDDGDTDKAKKLINDLDIHVEEIKSKK